MKKIIFAAAAVFAFGVSSAQMKKGDLMLEANTGFGSGVGSTAFGFSSEDGNTAYNLGLEGGYFIADDLAVKVGFGFGGEKPDGGDATSAFAYKVGAKYYALSMIPVEVSYNGVSVQDAEENPSYIGLQGGYAIKLSEDITLEPGLRYNYSLNDDFFKSILQFNVGFALHF
jgi:hypothetical protein